MKRIVVLFSVLVLAVSCQKIAEDVQPSEAVVLKTLSPFLEDMELGTKTAYATGNVTLSTGSWSFNDALIGNSTSDKKSGTKSARIRNSGKLTMLTDKANGAGTVSIKHASYGSDASSSWQLWYSTDGGATYVQNGTTQSTLAGNLVTATFTLNVTGNVRLEIRKTDGSTNRINIDDVTVSDYSGGTTGGGGGTTGGGTTGTGTKKFLFDAKHAQTAANADWVIDGDNNIPQQLPTPLQSNITASTVETYWTGALSSWGIGLVKLGHTVETLPSSGSLTYGNTSNPQDLMNYDVFVCDEPNILFTTAEKSALMQFVQNGGGLFIIADHTNSDRNNDGYDSPAIWNNFFTSNGVVSNPFGISFNLLTLTNTTTNVTSLSNAITNGSQGAVTSIQFNGGTSMTLSTAANASVKGLIWKSASTQNSSNVFVASSTYGTGRVVAIGDSSPMDDGTGNPGDVLYNGWSAYSHSKLMMNASLWLAKL